MGIRRNISLGHWNFFLALEEDLDRLSRYVEFAEKNETAYSIEIARLLLAASAEVDALLKLICQRHADGSTADNINQYWRHITELYPGFVSYRVTIPRFGITLTPWIDWKKTKPPQWWSDHNKVKHSRDKHFERATLKNCLNAMAGLFAAVLHLYEREARAADLLPVPRVFHVADEHFGGVMMGGRGSGFVYLVQPAA
jgi:hypothetical protein